MTEIPEHLLKRSRDRRAALGLGGDDAPSDIPAASAAPLPAASTPATAAPSAPVGRAAAAAPAAPPPPKPDSFVVAAYRRRRKIPFWAMMALSLLPVWMFMYARAVTTQAREATGPLGVGAATYGNCASCHGGSGEGISGYKFADGEVLKTFPHIEDQLRFVTFGSAEYNLAGIEIYGNPDREGGPHITGALGAMPGWSSSLSDAEILGVVCHERYTLGGADPEEHEEEYELWCSEESDIFVDLEAGGSLADVDQRFEGVIPIGDAPAAGLAPDE